MFIRSTLLCVLDKSFVISLYDVVGCLNKLLGVFWMSLTNFLGHFFKLCILYKFFFMTLFKKMSYKICVYRSAKTPRNDG